MCLYMYVYSEHMFTPLSIHSNYCMSLKSVILERWCSPALGLLQGTSGNRDYYWQVLDYRDPAGMSKGHAGPSFTSGLRKERHHWQGLCTINDLLKKIRRLFEWSGVAIDPRPPRFPWITPVFISCHVHTGDWSTKGARRGQPLFAMAAPQTLLHPQCTWFECLLVRELILAGQKEALFPLANALPVLIGVALLVQAYSIDIYVQPTPTAYVLPLTFAGSNVSCKEGRGHFVWFVWHVKEWLPHASAELLTSKRPNKVEESRIHITRVTLVNQSINQFNLI